MLTLWNLTTAHTGPATAVAVGVDRGRLVVVSGGSDRLVRIWDPQRGGCTALDVGATVTSLALGDDSTVVVGTVLGVVPVR